MKIPKDIDINNTEINLVVNAYDANIWVKNDSIAVSRIKIKSAGDVNKLIKYLTEVKHFLEVLER